MIVRTAMWFLVKFEEVIRAIENPLGGDLIRYNEAGVLWGVSDLKGHSPLLYFIDKKTSDPKYTQADFVKHLRKLASVDPIQTEVGFRQGALQLLRNKDFMLLKALFDHYAILKTFIPNSDDPEKFRSLYAQILEGLSQFNARKVLPNKSRADQPSVLDSLFGELEKAAFHTAAMREGLIAALENDTETKVAIVKKILRYAHQKDNIISLLQGATENENIFVLLKKKSGAAYRIEILLKSLALLYRQESNTQDALNFLHVVKMTDYQKSILLNALTEKKLDVKKSSCEAPLIFSSVALSNNSLSYYAGDALSGWCNNNHFTVLDLSNNPMLASRTWPYSSGLQLIARALRNNTTLKMLILAACGADNKDFLTLVDMLKVNSGLRDLDLSRNRAITETEIQKNLLALYHLRYTRELRALRPRLDVIIEKKEHSAFNTPSSQTIFHQHIRAHIEQLRLHSLGVQLRTQEAQVQHGSSVWDQIGHFLHFMVLVSSTAGVVLGVVEILKTMKFTLHNFEHGFHKTEDIIEVFEKLYLGSMGLKIILDTIAQIRETGGELSEEFYSRYQKHGFKQTTMRTFWDFIYYLYALLESEHKNDLLLFFQKFDRLAISINTDKVAAELAHNFSDCEVRVNNPFEIELLADTVGQYFNQFCKDSHIMIDWSCVAQEFSHWALAKELKCTEVLEIEKGLVIFTGDEDLDRDTLGQSEDEWAIDVIRRRGFRCYGNENGIIDFNVRYKKIGVEKQSHEWITTDGDRFGYYPIGEKFLRMIQEKIQGYQKVNAQTRIISIDNVRIEYEISAKEMERLRQHTLTAILSGYQPTDEQLRYINAAITDLRAKVEALSKKTDENTVEIARVKQTVDSHATKHQLTDERLEKLEGRRQSTVNSHDEVTDEDIKIGVLEQKVGVLESEVGDLKSCVADLKKINGEQQEKNTILEATVGNLTARIDALLGQHGQDIAVVNNAAINADIAGRRADQQNLHIQVQLAQANNNQQQAGAGNGAVLPEDARENQANDEERGPPIPPVHNDLNLGDDDTQGVNSINSMK